MGPLSVIYRFSKSFDTFLLFMKRTYFALGQELILSFMGQIMRSTRNRLCLTPFVLLKHFMIRETETRQEIHSFPYKFEADPKKIITIYSS